jgi:hypothetical protein
MLTKFHAAPGPDDPLVSERRKAREALVAERAIRIAQRQAARQAHEAELAAQAEREAAQRRARAEAERVEREGLILAAQKARKVAKQQWRKGLEGIKESLHGR